MTVPLSHRSVSQTVCARTPTTTPTLVCALSPRLPACSTASLMTMRYIHRLERTFIHHPNKQEMFKLLHKKTGKLLTAPWWSNGNTASPAGVCRSLQHDDGSVPAEEHRKDHRPGGPGEDEPPADDVAVLRRAVMSDARRVRSKVCSGFTIVHHVNLNLSHLPKMKRSR